MKRLKRLLAIIITFSLIFANVETLFAKDMINKVISKSNKLIFESSALGEDETESTDLELESADLEQGETENSTLEETTAEEASSLPMQADVISTNAIEPDIDIADLEYQSGLPTPVYPGGDGWTFDGYLIEFTNDAAGKEYNIVGDNQEHRFGITVDVGEENNVKINLNRVKFDTIRSVSVSAAGAAFHVKSGLVTVNLTGENLLKSGSGFAGLQVEGVKDKTTVTITADSVNHSLNAIGYNDAPSVGVSGAGIGGGPNSGGSFINIKGGSIIASGGHESAGIGGGCYGNGSDIRIENATVEARGGQSAAGIGGGRSGHGKGITISGGKVTARGGARDDTDENVGGGAGIGGGCDGNGDEITISGGETTANGGNFAAGIGSGDGGNATDIKITAGIVNAIAGSLSAGIGGGNDGDASNIKIAGGTVIATGGVGAGSGAGIGGGSRGNGDGIVISNGNVTARGGSQAAGIGGGYCRNGKNIEITDGIVKVIGGYWAAGIGGGSYGNGEIITISGGDVTAIGVAGGAGIGGGSFGKGEGITISGGDVTAKGGEYAAGIGGGGSANGETITISGGKVTASGGIYGSGIGGGSGVDSINIKIESAVVTAIGGDYAAGIGGGSGGNANGITISSGEVTATGGAGNANDGIGGGAGIGGGTDGNGEHITISGGKVTATGGQYGAGIGGGASASLNGIIISGGYITAKGGDYAAGIGGGGSDNNVTDSGSCKDILISLDAKILAIGGISGVSIGAGNNSDDSSQIGAAGDVTIDTSAYLITVDSVSYNLATKSTIVGTNNVCKFTVKDGKQKSQPPLGGVDVKTKYFDVFNTTINPSFTVYNGLGQDFSFSKASYDTQRYLSENITSKDIIMNATTTTTSSSSSSNSSGYPAKESRGYSLSYHLNGGEGSFDIESLEKSGKITIADKVPIKAGYKFVIWNTKLDGSGTDYKAGDVLELDKNIILYAQWGKIEVDEVQSHPFTDIDNHWAEKDIIDIYHKGLMKGVSKTLFAPNTGLSRAMMITILWRLEGSPSTNSSTFSDIELNIYYKNAVDWGSENKIIFGTGGNNFSPNNPITREELCTILYRYEQFKGGNSDVSSAYLSFKDYDDISNYAETSVDWAFENDLIKGTNEDMLNPKSGATRAEIASILNKYLAE